MIISEYIAVGEFVFELFKAVLCVGYVASIYYIVYDYIWRNFTK
tara:strand:+ start:86 stop:217 length:132 start_codon:yes stop_codon:yes gene_type:complete